MLARSVGESLEGGAVPALAQSYQLSKIMPGYEKHLSELVGAGLRAGTFI